MEVRCLAYPSMYDTSPNRDAAFPRVAEDVVRLTDRITRTATVENRPMQAVRNAALQLIGQPSAAGAGDCAEAL